MMQKLLKNNIALLTVMVLALALLIFSGVQTSRAALMYISDEYVEQIQTSYIGITIVQTHDNGGESTPVNVSWRNFVPDDGTWNESTGALTGEIFEFSLDPADPATLLANEEPDIGRRYDVNLRLQNTGSIDEYVRVVIRRYFTGPDGEKDLFTDPKLIDLELNLSDGWQLSEEESTDETVVLYYSRLLPVGELTVPFLTGVTLSQEIKDLQTVKTHKETNDGFEYTFIDTIFDLDGSRFHLDVEAAAVQDHNANAAMNSAWGVMPFGVTE